MGGAAPLARSDRPAANVAGADGWPRLLFVASVLAVVYFAAAKLGLALASIHPSASAIWPPTGIALAAVLLFGARVAPGVFLGAFLANVTTAGTVATSLAIAGGNTLEAIVGAALVVRFGRGRRSFESARGVFAFALLAGFLATTLSATVGVTSLTAAGFAPWEDYAVIWTTWWIGDAAGAVVVAPLLLLWSGRWPRPASAGRAAEAVFVGACLGLSSLSIFTGMLPVLAANSPLSFLPLPFVVWGAYRFGPRGAASLTAILCAVATWGTVRGTGPFGASGPGLLLLGAFAVVVGVTSLVLGAVVVESRLGSAELARERRRFQAIIDQSPIAVTSFAPDGRPLRVNAAVLALRGITRAQAEATMGTYNLFEDEQLASEGVLPLLERAFAGEVVRVPAFRYDPAKQGRPGRARWIEVFAYPVKDETGRVQEVIVAQEDLTERKSTEEEVRVAHARFKVVFEEAGVGIVLFDPVGRVLDVNGTLARMLGYERGDLVGLGVDMVERVTHPDDFASDLALFKELVEGKRARYDLEKRYVRKDGTVLWGHLTVSIVRDGTGAPRYVVATVQDINARKGTEEEIRRYRDHLEELVRERTDELAGANRDLEAFTARVSHDLRAPVRAVEVLTQAIVEDHGSTLDPAARGLLERVTAESRRMAKLVDDLLRLTRSTRDGLRKEAIDLGAIAREVLGELRKREPERRVEVVVADGLEATGDASLMRVLLENLVGNAWKFTSKRLGARIEVGVTEIDGERAVFVRDNGVGFPQERAGELFRAFARLHSDADFPGTGIGLTTVQTIVARHGGRVWAESKPGQGATFFFTLRE